MIDTVAACGMNCALCHSYQDGKKPCPGCRGKASEIRKSCRNCAIANCERQTGYCYDCPDFPCKRLAALDKRYRTKYGMSMLANLARVREIGEDVFVCEQADKYRCPTCGKLRTVHDDHCLHCKAGKE